MKITARLLAVTLLLVLSSSPAAAQLWGMGASAGSEPAAPTASRLPAAQPDAVYRFHPTSTTVSRSRHFDLVKDTPTFINAGQSHSSPGGTCHGMAYMTQYWYERIVYPFLGLGQAVTQPDLGVPSIPAGDTATFESKRLKRFTTGRAGRDRFQRLSASAHRNFDEWGNGLTRGAESSYDEWIGNVGNAEQGLGFLWFQEKNAAWSHTVLVRSAQVGQARANGATSGPRVTSFAVVDSNRTYASAGDHADDYVMYFHDAERAGLSPEYNAHYGNGPHDGAFLDEGHVGHYSPYGWWARWNATCEDTTQGADIQWGGSSSGTRSQAKGPTCDPEPSW